MLTFLQRSNKGLFLPVLLLFTAVTIWLGSQDPGIAFRPRTSPPALRRWGAKVCVTGLAMIGLTALVFPDLFLQLPREQTRLWLLVLVLYPLLSVAPQETIYRTFFMQRYAPLFGPAAGMRWINALAFGWGHLFFLNWAALVLSGIGGLLLADTWQKTKSFKWVCIEHALYGQILFTCGLGRWFRSGTLQSLQVLSGG